MQAIKGEFFQIALGTADYTDAERRIARRNTEAKYFAKIDQARAGVKILETRSPSRSEVHDIARRGVGTALHRLQDALETDVLPLLSTNADAMLIEFTSRHSGQSRSDIAHALDALRSESAMPAAADIRLARCEWLGAP